MQVIIAIIVCIVPLGLIVRSILLIKRSAKISKFMKDILIVILIGVFLISFSVAAHHFLTFGTARENDMSLGVLVMVQSIISSVIFLTQRRLV